MAYVDGFLLTVPKDRIEDYRKIAEGAGKIWKEHGALSYVEAVGDDLHPKGPDMPEGAPQIKLRQFDKVADAEGGDAVVFAFITFKDRAHRDEVNAKVMVDPRMGEGCDPNNMPMDPNKMAYGGFKSLVSM